METEKKPLILLKNLSQKIKFSKYVFYSIRNVLIRFGGLENSPHSAKSG